MSQTILISGGTGFLGRHLGAHLRSSGDTRVVLAARNNEQNRKAGDESGCEVLPMDVTNIESVRDTINAVRPDVFIHAAATKYVDLSEREPFECIDVNVVGSENVARVAIDKKVPIVLGISTDKAAPPTTTTYGMSKAIMERLFCALDGRSDTRFGNVRFGNIAWSTGSVFPPWREMAERDGVIGSTGPEMRRYFFSIDEATGLVARAIDNMDQVGGRVLSIDMGAAQMSDILDVWKDKFGTDWERLPPRPGDSIDQGLIGDSEVGHTKTIQLDGHTHYLCDFRDRDFGDLTEPLTSETARRLTVDEISTLLDDPALR